MPTTPSMSTNTSFGTSIQTIRSLLLGAALTISVPAAMTTAFAMSASDAVAQAAPGGGLPEDTRSQSEQAIALAEAHELFRASGKAMQEIGPMAGNFVFSASGSELIAQALNDDLTGSIRLMPSGATEDDLKTTRDSAWGSQWLMRFTGAGKFKKSDPVETEFDTVFGPLTTTWVDRSVDTVFERTPSAAFQRSEVGSAMRLMAMREFATEMPLDVVMDAEAYFIEENQVIDGIECRVVLVRHKPEQVSTGASSPTKPFAMRESRYFIGVDDRVLRRVDRIGNFGLGLSLTFSLEFADLGPEASLTSADFTIETPEGFRRDVGSAAARTNRRTAEQNSDSVETATAPPAPTTTPAVVPSRMMAPGFTLPDGSGGTVSSKDMAGEVTVLYWWGTWCIPCRDVSPLVSAMAEEYGDTINVVGMAYRERDPTQPKAYLATNGYGFQLALADDDTAQAYAIRAYPSVVVIAQDGTIEIITNKAARPEVARNEQAGAMMADVRAAVDKLLGS